MSRPTQHRSIEAQFPNAAGLDLLDASDRAVIAKRLGMQDSGRAALEQSLGDAAFLRGLLVRLPPLCLVTLEMLVEHGGGMGIAALRGMVAARGRCPVPHVDGSLAALVSSGLVVALCAKPGGPVMRYALLADAAPIVAALLAGVSLPAEPPADDADTHDSRRQHRTLLAIAALAAHRAPRVTRGGRPDRTSVKRVSKDLGVSPEQVEQALAMAIELGWMTLHGGTVSPRAQALVAASQGVHAASTCGVAALGGLVRLQGWTSIEELARAYDHARRAAGRDSVNHLAVVARDSVASTLASLPGLQVCERDGERWVRRIEPARRGGDGHVTPSFEVLLGPDADLTTVVRVGLGCELMRIDHVLSLRLTQRSVAAALACGLLPDELRDALAAVGPHGLPENVAFMLEDWINAVRPVQVHSGTFVFCDAATGERLASSLGDWVRSRPAPGVLQLRGSIGDATLHKALGAAGVTLDGSSTLAPVDLRTVLEEPEDAWDGASEPPLPLALLPQGDAALRQRLLSGPDPRDTAPQSSAASSAVRSLHELAALAHKQQAPIELQELFELLGAWQNGLQGELQSWCRRLRPAARREVEAAIECPVPLLPWIALTDKWRHRMLKKATDLGSLNRLADSVAQPQRLRPGGDRALDLFDMETVRAAIERAVERGIAPGLQRCEHCGVVHESQQRASRNEADAPDAAPPPPRRPLDAPLLAARSAALEHKPRPGAMPRTTPAGLRELLERSAERERILHLEVNQNGKALVHAVIAEGLRRRGPDEVLLATDLTSLDSRVFRVADITAARVDDRA
jgi:hypothetical protein